jgi:hypothetical protein
MNPHAAVYKINVHPKRKQDGGIQVVTGHHPPLKHALVD